MDIKNFKGHRSGSVNEAYVATGRTKVFILIYKKPTIWADDRGLYVVLDKAITYVLGKQWKEKYPLAWQLVRKDIKMANIALNLFLKYEIAYDKQILDKVKTYDLRTGFASV